MFTPELAEAICERLAAGESLIGICRDEGMPGEVTVRRWATEDRDGFSAKYAQARETGYERWADEIVEISDDARNDWMKREEGGKVLDSEHVQRSRLRVDTRKWLLSKMLPKRFGEKQTLEHTGADGTPLTPVVNLTIRSPDGDSGT